MSDPNDNLDPAARLAALAGLTQSTDAENLSSEQVQQAAEQQQQISESEKSAQEWGILMFTAGGFACMIAPELKPVYSQERCLDWGRSVTSVCEKYGLTGMAAMPEIALIVSTAGFALPSYFAIKAKISEAKEGKGPNSWLAKVGLWWRTRKARAPAMPTGPAHATEPAPAP